MASIAVLQFITELMARPGTRWIVLALAVLGVACFGAAEWIHDKGRKKWEAEQPARTRRLVLEIAEELRKAQIVYVAESPAKEPIANSQTVLSKAERFLVNDDPRIYVGIEPAKEAMFPRTPFVFDNRGGSTAHKVVLNPFKLDRKTVEVSRVEIIQPGGKALELPEVEKADGVMNKNDIFQWLLRDWNANGELTEEWPIPLRVEYEDFSRQKFAAMMTLVFFPIRHIMSESRNWPNYDEPTWEMRNIEFEKI